MSRFEGSPDNSEQLKVIEVLQDEWRAGEEGTLLKTNGVEPCIVVAIHNPGKGAFLGHFSDPMNIHTSKTMESFDSLMDLLKRMPDDKSAMQFWVGGGASAYVEPAEYTEQIDGNIDYVLEKIKQLGADENKIEIGLSGYHEAMDVTINSSNGAIGVNSTTSWD